MVKTGHLILKMRGKIFRLYKPIHNILVVKDKAQKMSRGKRGQSLWQGCAYVKMMYIQDLLKQNNFITIAKAQ